MVHHQLILILMLYHYCEDLDFANQSDWRLPTIEELYSITDQRKSSAPFVDSMFENVENSWYWSITKYNSNPSNSWLVSFNYGNDSNGGQSYSNYVRCVR